MKKSLLGAAAVTLALTTTVLAGDVKQTDASKADEHAVRVSGTVDYSYVGQGDTKFRGVTLHESDAHRITPSIAGEYQITDKWFTMLGAASEHVFLEQVSGAPMPERINVMRLNAGVGYRINEKWTVAAGAGPLFYDLERVDSQTIGFGGVARAVYRPTQNLTVVMGLAVAPDSDIPVFPAAGVIWKLETNLTLNLVMPKPRVTYQILDNLGIYAGGDVRFAVFRTDGTIQDKSGVAGFNNALATYRDFHLGAGVEYQAFRNFFLEAEAGYSVGRQIDYKRIDEKVEFDPAPYVHAGVHYRF